MSLKCGVGLLLVVAGVALSEPPETIQRLRLDDRVVITVSVATNRITTISFPGPISAIDAANVSADPTTDIVMLRRLHPGERPTDSTWTNTRTRRARPLRSIGTSPGIQK